MEVPGGCQSPRLSPIILLPHQGASENSRENSLCPQSNPETKVMIKEYTFPVPFPFYRSKGNKREEEEGTQASHTQERNAPHAWPGPMADVYFEV